MTFVLPAVLPHRIGLAFLASGLCLSEWVQVQELPGKRLTAMSPCGWVLSLSESPPGLLFIIASRPLPCGELEPEHGTSCE